jgi:ATP-dependent Lhr-like helicase
MTLEAFHPAVRRWFLAELGEPTPAQVQGWPAIRAGGNVLIAAPTGTGKTLAAFLWALDGLFRQGEELRDETQVVYVSPLRALSNDVQKNLQAPLAAIRALDPSLPELRVLVRTGDTPARERSAMGRRPPHVLVTTPESLYILLTSAGGRGILCTARTVIVDEIHALARDKRGSHLALSLERLEQLCLEGGGSSPQRIGLSATQKPLDAVGQLLCGVGRECERVDAGHLRHLDLDIVVPDIPLAAVCSHEQWAEIHARMAELIRAHRTTLVFVNTRKLAERLAARLTEVLGAGAVACHHGSLSREMRLDAEQRLKAGELKALVATASLELGIDIGDVDLVCQVGSSRTIATLLQRVGRAGHGVRRVPKGRVFPLTLDEAVEAVALLRAIRGGRLDRTPEPPAALDILAQQVVAACAGGEWREDELYERFRRAWPYRNLSREDFDSVLALHATGRTALLHRDAAGGRVRGTRRARIPALTSGGAIPDNADYRVVLEPEGTFVGTLNEDFAIEANRGDIFQLGNTSWQILKVEPGTVRVADAAGQPPTLPFWLGEAPGRSRELSLEVARVREECTSAGWIEREVGAARDVAGQVADYLAEGRAALGGVPTERRVIAERFFDESGGMQLVIHAPCGSRVNRALGLALRKRICRGFGFELQAAADEEAVVLSLGAQHSFELQDVFHYLRSAGAREVLVQALLASPLFTARWRWNAVRSLLLPRVAGGRSVPPPIRRMRAEDLLARAFPQAVACGETLPPGDVPVPMEHPIVRQTVEDCLHEALDVNGLIELLEGIESGRIETRAVDTPEPSPFARGILAAHPYSFLDDAPLEERRTQAVLTRRALDARIADDLGALDPEAIARVRAEAWPQPESAEELHEVLGWMGFLEEREVAPWRGWLDELASAGRAVREGERWFALEAPRAGVEVLRGRLEALGPLHAGDPLTAEFAAEMLELESRGDVLRVRFDGAQGWCNRRLLARIQRYTLGRLRRAIEPVSAAQFLRFLAVWQHADPAHRLHGPRGVLEVVAQLAGFQAPPSAWERQILPARVEGFRGSWLDELSLSGELSWGRLWGSGAVAPRSTPLALVPREELEAWLNLAEPIETAEAGADARKVLEVLERRGASFQPDLARHTGLLPWQLDAALGQLVALGLATCDAFSGLRSLARAPGGRKGHTRARTPPPSGRWSPWRRASDTGSSADEAALGARAEFAARALLRRTGIVFRRTFERERIPVSWRELWRALRRLEVRGEVHGGRFVAGFSGEQFALPEAVSKLRQVRDTALESELSVAARDPLNFSGLLTPAERVPSNSARRVQVAV